MRDLVIFGTGGFAREVRQVVADLERERPRWTLRGFLDGDPARHGTAIRDLPVLGGAAWLADRPDVAGSSARCASSG